MAATALGSLHFDGLEDPVVGRGWLTRAARMLEYEEPCVENGYALIGLMGASVASAEELDACARIALELAHRFQDRNLECKALGDSGLALVSMGRIRDGMTRLDEAFTMIIAGERAHRRRVRSSRWRVLCAGSGRVFYALAVSCVELPRMCRSRARPICVSISVPSISTTRRPDDRHLVRHVSGSRDRGKPSRPWSR
jgi:hypothetical protein